MACLFLALAVACLATPAAGGEDGGAEAAISYQFHFEPRPRARFFVKATFAGGPHGFTVFGGCLSEWSGLLECGRLVEEVTVRSVRSGEILPVERLENDIWSVDHAPGELIVVAYQLVQAEASIAGVGVLVAPHFVSFVGDGGLLVPEHLMSERSVRIQFSWRGPLPPEWMAAGSFATGPPEAIVHMPLTSILNGLFFWGRAFVDPPGAGASPTIVWLNVEPRSPFRDALHRSLLSAEAAVGDYLGRQPDAATTWFVLPESLEEISAMALNGSILLLVDPTWISRTSPDLAVSTLTAAHELVHVYVGDRLNLSDGPVPPTFFAEGLAELVARRALYRAGFLDVEAWAKAVSDKLEAHQAPRGASTADPATPYVLGDLLLLLVDHEIRRVSRNEADVLVLIDDLAAPSEGGSTGAWSRSWTEFRSALEARTSARFAKRFEVLLNGGERLRLEQEMFVGCLELQERPIHAFDPGFDVERSVESRRARGVGRGGPAWRAGLRDGDVLLRWSVQRDRTDVPVELVASRGDEEVHVRYFPLGSVVSSHQYVVPARDDARCDEVL